MNSTESNIIELLEYLEEMIDNSAKMPMTGKVMIDRREFSEVIEQIMTYLPDQIKRAQWVMEEKDKILLKAREQYDSARKESVEIMKNNIENHDIVREAKAKANEIIALAQKDAKAIRVGTREYSTEILSQLDLEIEKKKKELISFMQSSFEKVAVEIDANLSDTSKVIKENISELRNM